VMLALSEALGRSADVSVTFEPGAEDRAPTILARASGAQAGADVALATREGAVAVREATARMTVSAGRATSLLAALTAGDAPEAAAAQEEAREQPAPEQGGPIAVVGADVPLVLTVQPVTVPMEGWRPRAGADAAAVAAVSIDGPVRLEQIEGRVQEITLVIADAQAQVTAPIASLLPAAGEGEAAAAGDQRKPMQATLSAGLQDGQGESIASINGEATIAPDRTLRQARAVVDEIDTFRIDDMLGVEGAVSGLLGDTATIRAALTPQSATLRTIDMEVLAPNVSGA